VAAVAVAHQLANKVASTRQAVRVAVQQRRLLAQTARPTQVAAVAVVIALMAQKAQAAQVLSASGMQILLI
jgi:hypothetical protein